MPEISDKELRFCEEYLRDRIAVRAALEVGLSSDYNAAANQATYLLKKPEIQAWLKYLRNQYAKRLRIDIPSIIREYAIIAKSDLDEFTTDETGRVVVRPGVPKKMLRAVKKRKLTKLERLNGDELTVSNTAEIELHDKLHALDQLLKYFKDLLPKKSEEDGEGTDEPNAAEVMRIVADALSKSQPRGSGGTGGEPAGEGGDVGSKSG